MIGVHSGSRGGESRDMRASLGVRFALRRLQGTQARTQFSQEEAPPRERGCTWSIVSSLVPGR